MLNETACGKSKFWGFFMYYPFYLVHFKKYGMVNHLIYLQ